jgi:hypothetical protein
MSQEWYYAKGDKQYGPVTAETLKASDNRAERFVCSIWGVLNLPTRCGSIGAPPC